MSTSDTILGRGGFGLVYAGRARYLGREFDVAVKVLSKYGLGAGAEGDTRAAEAKARFLAECEVALRASRLCSNVCTMYAVWNHPRHGVCLVMEKYKCSLRDLIHGDGGGLSIGTVFQVARGVCNGMAQLHREPLHIVVRDLKPPNVLIDAAGEAYLADFGLARELSVRNTARILAELEPS